MDKENFIIKPFLNELNGDDGAVLGKWCFSKDLFFEGVHFERGWLSCEQIAAKALLVNISDAIVMNAVPKYALLGLALPRDISNADIKALQRGFLKTAREFGIKIIGGDTISADKMGISVSLISRVRKKAIYRKGLRKGDLLAFTGELGESLRGLKMLQKAENSHKSVNFGDLKGLKKGENSQNALNLKDLQKFQNGEILQNVNLRNLQGFQNDENSKNSANFKALKNPKNAVKLPKNHRFIKPNLRGEFFYKIAHKVRCAMDISDGLGQDLAKMLTLNGLGVNFLTKLSADELNSGEEYEILLAFAPKHRDFMLKTAAKFGVKLNIFAEAAKGKYEFSGRKWHF